MKSLVRLWLIGDGVNEGLWFTGEVSMEGTKERLRFADEMSAEGAGETGMKLRH